MPGSFTPQASMRTCRTSSAARCRAVGVAGATVSKGRGSALFFEASDWFVAFLLTLAVELPVVVVLLRRVEPDLPRVAGLVAFANLATHPIVWFVLTQPFVVGTPEYLLVAESWAFAAEAVFYAVTVHGIGPGRAVGVSFAANAASFLVGQVVLDRMLEIVR